MKGDIFVNNNKTNIFQSGSNENNFFVQQESFQANDMPTEPVRRLNDYDYNILREDAYKDVSDELFKLEYKISRLEEELTGVDGQIQSARDISDYDTVEYLINRKKQLKEDLDGLVEIYNDKSLSAKISGSLFNIISPNIKSHFSKLSKNLNSLKNNFLSSMSGKFASVQELKQSLNKLESINKSVDELMTLQTPYGEAGEKYDQLSKYITRANTIQAKISRLLK